MKATRDNVLAVFSEDESEKAGNGDMHPVGALVPAHLLVVEDNSTVRDYYAHILTAAGYYFDLAENGEVGWESVQARDYSLIITDHDMPRLTGLGLINRLSEGDYRVPVILISGSLSREDTRLVGLSLLAMVCKPISVASLLAKIKEAISLELPLWFTHPVVCSPSASSRRASKLQGTSILAGTQAILPT
jgi:DNA-binding response OmpR family regulator